MLQFSSVLEKSLLFLEMFAKRWMFAGELWHCWLFLLKKEMLLIVSCNSSECGLRGSILSLFMLRKEDLFLSGELGISTVLMSETLSVHYLQREEQMRCCWHSLW